MVTAAAVQRLYGSSGPMSVDLPRRVRVGRRRRRAPDRRRQLEQRLVGVRARARHAVRRAVGRLHATASTATPTTSRWSATSASAPTGSRSSGRGSSPRTASSRAPRSTTTGACSRRATSTACSRSVTFHHFTTPAVDRRRAAAGRRPRSSTSFARFCETAVAHLGDLIVDGLHDQRAEHRVADGLRRRRVPARARATSALYAKASTSTCAPRTGVRTT